MWGIPESALIAIIVGWIWYFIVQNIYNDKQFDLHVEDLRFMVRIQKKLAKGRILESPKEDKVKMGKITKQFDKVDVSDYPEITTLFTEIFGL